LLFKTNVGFHLFHKKKKDGVAKPFLEVNLDIYTILINPLRYLTFLKKCVLRVLVLYSLLLCLGTFANTSEINLVLRKILIPSITLLSMLLSSTVWLVLFF